MKIMPVSRVCHGIGLSSPPTSVSRSAGTPDKSKSMADSASHTTTSASPRISTPE